MSITFERQVDGTYAQVDDPPKLADMVAVVRCRDCAKWSFFDVEDNTRIGDCAEWTHLDGFNHATNENGFCAWGERREQ